MLGNLAMMFLVAAKLTTDRGLVALKLKSNLCHVLIGFHEAVNLISFDLTEVFEIYLATSTGRVKKP